MAKKIIREAIIMLLLCIAIMLLLGVVLYTYTPGNKTMPEKVSYTIPADVKKELEEAALSEDEQIILTYEINSNDLTNYQRINDYNPGKPNPFSSYQTEEVEEVEETTQTKTAGNTTKTTGSTETGKNVDNNTVNNNENTTNGASSNKTTSQKNNTKNSTVQSNTTTSPYTHDKGTK